MGNNVTV